ncbi:MAG: hypothetical protein K9L28_08950 [Synergistales bacterium]|nr:hypothetical protein [Synergistales bacterium]
MRRQKQPDPEKSFWKVIQSIGKAQYQLDAILEEFPEEVAGHEESIHELRNSLEDLEMEVFAVKDSVRGGM